MDKISGNIWRYQMFVALAFTPFMLPVLVLFWQENGLDMFDVFLLQGIFAVAVVILEVPTGMVADRLGKRVSLIAASSTLLAGMLVYAIGFSFWTFLIAEIILAIGLSLLSGADSALLYDSLKAVGRADDFQQIEGRARAMQMTALALTNLIGGFVGEYSYRLTVWMSAIGPLIGLLLAIGFVEVNPTVRPLTLREGFRSYWTLISQSFRFVRKHRLVRWYVAFFAVTGGGLSWLLWLYQPYMELVGLPVWAFGVAFAGFSLFAAMISHFAHKIEKYLGQMKTILLIILLMLLPLPLMAFFLGPLSVLWILSHQAARAMHHPITKGWILRYTFADKRATVLSMGALGARLFFAVTSPLIGLVTREASLTSSLLFQWMVLAVLYGALLISFRRIPDKYFTVKDTVLQRQ